MQPAMRNYLELVMGLTDASRKKARKAVKDAVGRGNATVDQVKTLTTDLVAANSANREALSNLVRFEVDRALGVVGLATAEEVKELTARVRDLERQLREAEARLERAGDGVPARGRKVSTARKTARTTESAPATTTATKATPARKTAARTVARKAPARKAQA